MGSVAYDLRDQGACFHRNIDPLICPICKAKNKAISARINTGCVIDGVNYVITRFNSACENGHNFAMVLDKVH